MKGPSRACRVHAAALITGVALCVSCRGWRGSYPRGRLITPSSSLFAAQYITTHCMAAKRGVGRTNVIRH